MISDAINFHKITFVCFVLPDTLQCFSSFHVPGCFYIIISFSAVFIFSENGECKLLLTGWVAHIFTVTFKTQSKHFIWVLKTTERT